MMTTDQIRSEILGLGDEALAEVVELSLAECHRRRAEISRKKTLLFRPGQRVKFNGEDSKKLPTGAEGQVRKINQRTVSVDFGLHGSRWRVDACLLEPVSAPL